MNQRISNPCLWTDMLFELLYSGLDKPLAREDLAETLAYLRQKGFGPRELVRRARKERGDEAARRLIQLMSPVSKAIH